MKWFAEWKYRSVRKTGSSRYRSCLASKSNGRVADRRRQRWRSGLSLARLRKLPPVREGATVATDPPVDPDRYRRFHVESCSPNASRRRPAAKAGSRRNVGTRELPLARQFFEDAGDRGRGRHVFTEKHCSVCHREGSAAAAPNLTPPRDSFSAASMVAALWRHGLNMLAQMRAKKLAWPRFERTEMADLIAYLNSPGLK